MVRTKMNLIMDVIFENETDIKRVSEIVALPPVTLCQKGEKYYLKEEKIHDASRCRFDFDGENESFSEFVAEQFLPIQKNLQDLSEFVQNNGGEIRLTIYFKQKSRNFDFSIYGEAKEIIFKMKPDIYFEL